MKKNITSVAFSYVCRTTYSNVIANANANANANADGNFDDILSSFSFTI